MNVLFFFRAFFFLLHEKKQKTKPQFWPFLFRVDTKRHRGSSQSYADYCHFASGPKQHDFVPAAGVVVIVDGQSSLSSSFGGEEEVGGLTPSHTQPSAGGGSCGIKVAFKDQCGR